jgi:hypothetical protein
MARGSPLLLNVMLDDDVPRLVLSKHLLVDLAHEEFVALAACGEGAVVTHRNRIRRFERRLAGCAIRDLLSQQVETQFRSNNRQSVNYYSVTDEWATIQAQPYSWTLRRLSVPILRLVNDAGWMSALAC